MPGSRARPRRGPGWNSSGRGWELAVRDPDALSVIGIRCSIVLLIVEERGVVVEYIRYTVPRAESARFEEAYRQAGRLLEQDSHGVRYEIARDRGV